MAMYEFTNGHQRLFVITKEEESPQPSQELLDRMALEHYTYVDTNTTVITVNDRVVRLIDEVASRVGTERFQEIVQQSMNQISFNKSAEV